jgi:beta-galactosidase GanA
MPETGFKLHPDTPFPIGVEYYRAPTPKQEVWDEDFARIRDAGLRVVRSFTYWNWMEPQPGVYRLDDIDRLFDLAAKHDLYVWLDITLATHGSCPEWLMRKHPDIRSINPQGQPTVARAHPAYPQGGIMHCYDHPAWLEHGGGLLRHVVSRYRDRDNLLIWGLWDGVSPIDTGTRAVPNTLCYCDHTQAQYKRWLQERFSIEDLNERFQRRYCSWEDVEPPRNNNTVLEMLMFRRFHYENLIEKLKWMVEETRTIDPTTEVRAHSANMPRPWDEMCAREVDSWGMSMSSNNLLTSGDPSIIAERVFSFDIARAMGVDGRWWNEEIYAGMARGGVTWNKQSDPRELTALLWMSLAGGAAGAMFWQYRPEYLSFESPGYNLAALDGASTPRFEAVKGAVAQIESMRYHLPLECPRAEVGIVYDAQSQELFGFNDQAQRFNTDLLGVYRTLWHAGINADILTPAMDWSGYRLLFLPNTALMGDALLSRIERTLDDSPQTRLVAEGSFGLYGADGQSSYGPPEGLSDRLGVRVADFSAVTEVDIGAGRNVLQTPYGQVPIVSPCGYAVLEPQQDTVAIASLGEETIGVRSADGRFTWYGLTLSTGFGDVAEPTLVSGLIGEAGIKPQVAVLGQGAVSVVTRRSAAGGWLVFAFNLERVPVRVRLQPSWQCGNVQDLINECELALQDGGFEIEIEAWGVAVVHSDER